MRGKEQSGRADLIQINFQFVYNMDLCSRCCFLNSRNQLFFFRCTNILTLPHSDDKLLYKISKNVNIQHSFVSIKYNIEDLDVAFFFCFTLMTIWTYAIQYFSGKTKIILRNYTARNFCQVIHH